MVEPGTQRQPMHGKIRRTPLIHAHSVTTDAADIAFDQLFHRIDGKSRKMHAPGRIFISVAPNVRPARRPTRPEQHYGALWNLPVPFLPIINTRRGKLIVGLFSRFLSNIQNDGHPKKTPDRNFVYWNSPRRKMYRRVEVRSIMLQHPKAAREVAVLGDTGINIGLEPPFIPGPGDQFVVYRVREVQHSRFTGKDSFEHGITEAVCQVTPQFPPCAEFPGTRLP